MNQYKVKVVMNKGILTSIETGARSTFNDLNELILYVKSHGITIINPEALPIAFQKQLTTNQ